MLFTFLSTFAFSSLMSASPEVCGPGLRTPSTRPLETPPAGFPARPTVVEPCDEAVPAEDPEEFAVPELLVPGALGDLDEFPAPLGSLAALFSPPGLPGPFGTPFTAAGPAPAAPAAGDPAADPDPLEGPAAAPAA